ncbi:DUF3037 domain-containing protein [Rothia aerolata]|nr:DUF3037 domain-containing protein [Rothia aerolata]
MLYRYWVVRYVPDSGRPDTVGVGVIASSSKTGDSATRFITRYRDIPDIGGPRKEFAEFLRGFEHDLAAYSVGQSQIGLDLHSSVFSYVERVRRQNYGLLQIDAPMPASGNSADEVADLLFARIIARSGETQHSTHRVTDLRRLARESYLRNGVVAKRLVERPKLEVKNGSAKIDIAVVSDKYQEIARAFSFLGNPSQELRDRVIAWNFQINKLRDEGASLFDVRRNQEVRISPDAPVLAVIEYPRTKGQVKIYNEASADWEELGIIPMTAEGLPHHINSVQELLVA